MSHLALTYRSWPADHPRISRSVINLYFLQIRRVLQWIGSFLLLPFLSEAQSFSTTLSGNVKDQKDKTALAFVSLSLKTLADSVFVGGTITNENGAFSLAQVPAGEYILTTSYVGYQTHFQRLSVGSLSPYLHLGSIELAENTRLLGEVVISGKSDEVAALMDKKTFTIADNVRQSGGSVLQAMSALPGVAISQEGKVQLRGSEKVVVLIDGKQTALTGYGGQNGLDNLPASAIERIEIIQNPSAKYDANASAGIINLIFKKQEQVGFNGKIGLAAGVGAIWIKRENLPGIRPQFQRTPKINPSLSVNYRKKKTNLFLQADWLYAPTLNKNEFSTRRYDDGTVIYQQVKRNRTTDWTTAKTGIDLFLNAHNTLSISGLFNREKIIDRGDIPYFRQDFDNRYRLWQFLEDEVKYTAVGTAALAHKFKQPGHTLQVHANYSFHREDEQYFFTNILPTSTGQDAFKLLSDEQVADLNIDYSKPLRHGRVEAGFKGRYRFIPVNMQFFPGVDSPLDTGAGGWADYVEKIPAVYSNYIFENRHLEVEGGLRVELVQVEYVINPNHNTYKSDGYRYAQPFPNLRLAYKLDEANKISLFFNRRVDRPNEVDIRIFPKYDEPELIKVGNPALHPQFTFSTELGYKHSFTQGSFYAAAYHRIIDGTITRIATQAPGSVLLYNIFQNAGRSWNTGAEAIWQQKLSARFSLSANANLYRNRFAAFSVVNQYPVSTTYSSSTQQLTSGNVKLTASVRLSGGWETQAAAIWLAPDLLPQGRIGSRFSLDVGAKKSLQKGKGELFVNATDLLNTMQLRRTIRGANFTLESTDYYETQVLRAGVSYKF